MISRKLTIVSIKLWAGLGVLAFGNLWAQQAIPARKIAVDSQSGAVYAAYENPSAVTRQLDGELSWKVEMHGRILDLAIHPESGKLFVLDANGLSRLRADDGTREATLPLPGLSAGTLAVDSSGAVYLGGNGFVSKFTSNLSLEYTSNAGGMVTSVYPVGDGGAYAAIATTRKPIRTEVVRLAADGRKWLFRSDLGIARPSGLVFDGAALYVTGSTDSRELTVKNASQDRLNGVSDAFVARLDGSDGTIIWSTYLGGRGTDEGSAIGLSADGTTLIVGGSTTSPDFPGLRLGPEDGSHGGEDAFIADIDAAGGRVLDSTYYGTAKDDRIFAISAVGGKVHVAGTRGITVRSSRVNSREAAVTSYMNPQANLNIYTTTINRSWSGTVSIVVNPAKSGWALDPAFVAYRADTNPPQLLAQSACSGAAPCVAIASFEGNFTGPITLAVSGRIPGRQLQLADVLGKSVAAGTVPICVPTKAKPTCTIPNNYPAGTKPILFDTAGINPGQFTWTIQAASTAPMTGSGSVSINQSCDWRDLPLVWPYRFDSSVRPMYGNAPGAFSTLTYAAYPNNRDYLGKNDPDWGSDVDGIWWRSMNNKGGKTYPVAGGWLEGYRDNTFDHMDGGATWTDFLPPDQQGVIRFVPGQYDPTSTGGGNLIYLRHPNGFISAYYHNAAGLDLFKQGYRLNDWIPAETLMATLGSSGASGSYHWEISLTSGEGCRQRIIAACKGAANCGDGHATDWPAPSANTTPAPRSLAYGRITGVPHYDSTDTFPLGYIVDTLYPEPVTGQTMYQKTLSGQPGPAQAGIDYPLYQHCSNPATPFDFLDMAVGGTSGYWTNPPDDQSVALLGKLIQVQTYTCGVLQNGAPFVQVAPPQGSPFQLGLGNGGDGTANTFPASIAGQYRIDAMQIGSDGTPQSRGSFTVNVPAAMPAKILSANAIGTVTEASFDPLAGGSGTGGVVDGGNLIVGDAVSNLQQKGFVSFAMPTLPAGAQIQYAVIRMRLAGSDAEVLNSKTNQLDHGYSLFDMEWEGRLFADLTTSGAFFSSTQPASSAFNADAISRVAEMSKVTDVNAWSEGVLTANAIAPLNTVGAGNALQFRIYWESPTNRNGGADYVQFAYDPTTRNQTPQLIIYYTVPDGTTDSGDPAPVNVALGKTATQSSSGYGTVAGLAVDGNRSGSFSDGSVTHTADPASETHPYWQVDLGQSYPVAWVNLFNRTDYQSRLSDMYVCLSDTPFSRAVPDSSLCQYIDPDSAPEVVTTLDFNRSGRYLRVQSAGLDPKGERIVSLAEVEVYATPGGNQ